MLELVAGLVLGAIASLLIAHLYYRKSSQELEELIGELRSQIAGLQQVTDRLQASSNQIFEDTSLIRKHAAAGTPDDPDYPYR